MLKMMLKTMMLVDLVTYTGPLSRPHRGIEATALKSRGCIYVCKKSIISTKAKVFS